MKNLFAKKKGFTLIELLVVIAIVMLLSFMAINGYMDYKKSSLLRLSGDDLISQINEQKTRTVYGETDDTAKCYGISFADAEFSVFYQDFDTEKEFKEEKWLYKGCEGLDTTDKEVLYMDDMLEIISLELDLNLEIDDDELLMGEDFAIRFYPPHGDVELFDVADLIEDKVDVLNITMGYGEYEEVFTYKF